MNEEFIPEESPVKIEGNVLTLLYAEVLMPDSDALTSAELKELLEDVAKLRKARGTYNIFVLQPYMMTCFSHIE